MSQMIGLVMMHICLQWQLDRVTLFPCPKGVTVTDLACILVQDITYLASNSWIPFSYISIRLPCFLSGLALTIAINSCSLALNWCQSLFPYSFEHSRQTAASASDRPPHVEFDPDSKKSTTAAELKGGDCVDEDIIVQYSNLQVVCRSLEGYFSCHLHLNCGTSKGEVLFRLWGWVMQFWILKREVRPFRQAAGVSSGTGRWLAPKKSKSNKASQPRSSCREGIPRWRNDVYFEDVRCSPGAQWNNRAGLFKKCEDMLFLVSRFVWIREKVVISLLC